MKKTEMDFINENKRRLFNQGSRLSSGVANAAKAAKKEEPKKDNKAKQNTQPSNPTTAKTNTSKDVGTVSNRGTFDFGAAASQVTVLSSYDNCSNDSGSSCD